MKYIFLIITITLSEFEDLRAQEIYTSESLTISKLTENVFIHTSYLQTQDFGKVACNGMVYVTGEDIAVFDTPTTDSVSLELIRWIDESFNKKISVVIISHFHQDCLGGLKAFHDAGTASYAHKLTLQLAEDQGSVKPQNGFENQQLLEFGEHQVIIQFLGSGHTYDNTVCYLPSESVLFGGCLVKELGANEGYTDDGNVKEWSNTVTKVKNTFSEVKLVVPGHGKPGNQQLLDYTINLFSQYKD